MAAGTLRWAARLGALSLALCVSSAWLFGHAWPLLGALLAYGGVCLAVVVGLYVVSALGGDPGPWMAGESWRWMQPLVWPFRAVATVLWVLARWWRRDGPGVQVVPGVFVGPRPFAWEAARVQAMGVTALVDMTAELPVAGVYCRPPFTRLRVPTLDRTQPTDAGLDRAVAWALARHGEGAGVLVHCAFGRGRSAMVTAAVVLALGRAETVEEAVAVVARARPLARLRSAQIAGLRRFVVRLHAGGRLLSTPQVR